MEVDVRKVQKIGQWTLSVSLPKDWVKRSGIGPGDIVSVIWLEDGSLRIKPGLIKVEGGKLAKTVHVEEFNRPGLLGRIILALYLLGVNNITLVSERPMTRRKIEEVRRTVSMLPGLAVLEESPNRIDIVCFIESEDLPLWRLMRRLHNVSKCMLELVQLSMIENDADLLKDVYGARDDANKAYWLTLRQLTLANAKPNVQKKLNIGDSNCVPEYATVAQLMERISYLTVDLARNVEFILNSRDPNMNVEPLVRRVDDVMGVYTQAFESWMARDPRKAGTALNRSNSLEHDLRNESGEIIDGYLESGINSTLILSAKCYLDDLAQIVSFSGEIAEIAMNCGAMETSTSICKA